MDKEFKSNLNKALLISGVFLLFFSLIPLDWARVGDFNFHFERAANNCPAGYSDAACASYFPLLHLVGSLFSFSPLAFSNYLFLIIAFVTPMILFFTTRHWMSVWLYFLATQYVYLIQAGGAYPQALAGMFLLLFLFVKGKQFEHVFRFLILIVSLLAHSQAFVLLLLVWVVQLFFDNLKTIKSPIKHFFPACSAIFGKQAVDPIGQTVHVDLITKNGLGGINIILKDVANFFVRTFPLPFLLMAFWQLKKDKDWAFIVLTVLAFYYGIAAGQARIFLIVPLLLLPSLTKFYCNLDKKWKKWFILLTLITFAINFGTWGLYKIQCLA